MSKPFASIALDAASHFRLVLFGTVLRLADLMAPADRPAFLVDYLEESARLWGGKRGPSAAEWNAVLDLWAGAFPALPFNRLTAGRPALYRDLVATIALIEEDPSFAALADSETGFATLGGLTALWRGVVPDQESGIIRDLLLEMIAAGILTVSDQQAARPDWQLRLANPIHDLLSGALPRLDGTRFEPCDTLPDPATWVGDPDPAALAQMLRHDRSALILVRGPRSNGRRSLLRTAARHAGLNVLTVAPGLLTDPILWRTIGALAHAGNAMILAELQPAPGETIELPAHPLFTGVIGVASGMIGGVRAPGTAPTIMIPRPMPDAPARAAQWRATGLKALATDLGGLSLTSGNIRRAAEGAASRASLAGHPAITREDVKTALRDLRDAGLDALATLIATEAPEPLQLETQDAAEFDALLLRCRHREALGEPGGGRGVRALFAGPSGTGKTLAARHIAAALGKDLYRIDLSATVSKYIGETEKSLERALSAAESLNIVLLLDEGDALMARRTDVSSSNDRYANLETNFLLQRIESFDGILVVTSNDADRIDPAFSRRMDAVLTFHAPDEIRRHDILRQLLGEHQASASLLHDIACRCALSGGQLRNIALHARLLAFDAGRPIADGDLRQAVVREYRKTGEYCPLKLPLAAVG